MIMESSVKIVWTAAKTRRKGSLEMKIQMPLLNGKEQFVEGKTSIVLVGSNGAGKTRMSVWIDEHNSTKISVHRISAQKSLAMPKSIATSNTESSVEKFLYGNNNVNKDWLKNNKNAYRWGNEPNTHMLNDFSSLMEYLMTDYFQELTKKDNAYGHVDNDKIRLKRVKRLWESVITHRELKLSAGKVEVLGKNDAADTGYNGSQMSDGEREVFYFIGVAMCVPKDSLIIVDEPENHLHPSVLSRLWNCIEAERQDCTFLYITHNLDFASTRTNAQIIWVKSMTMDSGGEPKWDYQMLNGEEIPDGLLLEMLGSREKILLVEGKTSGSYDLQLYRSLFPDCSVLPLEGCSSVIAAVKSYRSEKMKRIHNKDVRGVVDRDRRTDEEITKLDKDGISVLGVSEIENLFLLPEVIRIVARDMHKNDEETREILADAETNALQFLEKHKTDQACSFATQRCEYEAKKLLNGKPGSIEEYAEKLNRVSEIPVADIFAEEDGKLDEIIESGNYLEALKAINNKALLTDSKVPAAFKWQKKPYVEYVLTLLKQDNETAAELRKAFLPYVPVHWGE